MSNLISILPGARVRSDDGLIGTVERLETHAEGRSAQPDHMVVRAEDGRWRYRIPLLLVRTVSQETLHTMVSVALRADELPHYIVESLAPPADEQTWPAVPPGVWSPARADETLRIPLAVEQLTAQKQSVLRGTVHIHKGVEHVEQRMTVALYHEEAVIERIPADQYDGSLPANPNETIIPIVEERLVVEKRTVVKEYIRVRKNVLTEQQDVHDTVRREFVEIAEDRREGAGSGAPLLHGRPARGDDPAGSAQPSGPSTS